MKLFAASFYYFIAIFLSSVGFCAEFLPPKEVFKPPVADLTWPSFSVHHTSVKNGDSLAEVAIGSEIGFARFPSGNGFVQIGMAGGVISRFNISKITNDFQTADFSLIVPVDYSRGNFTARLAYWHTSSHLGDDYIKSQGIPPFALEKAVTDDIRFIASLEPFRYFRLYGGAGYAFNMEPYNKKAARFQFGQEFEIPLGGQDKNKILKSFFAAFDWQNFARFSHPSFSARTGIKFAGNVSSVSVFAGYFDGKLPYLNFSDMRETSFSFGLIYKM